MDAFQYIPALRRDGAILPGEVAVQVADQYVAAFISSERGIRVLMFHQFEMVYTEVLCDQAAARSFARQFPDTWKKVTWRRQG